MNRAEAEARCAKLADEHPDRATHQWMPIKGEDDEWAVAKIPVPPAPKPTGTSRTDPRPSANDPRDNTFGGHLPPGWWAV